MACFVWDLLNNGTPQKALVVLQQQVIAEPVVRLVASICMAKCGHLVLLVRNERVVYMQVNRYGVDALAKQLLGVMTCNPCNIESQVLI